MGPLFPDFLEVDYQHRLCPLLTAQAVAAQTLAPDITPSFTVCNHSPARKFQGKFSANVAKPRGDSAVLVALVAKVLKENTPGKKG
jgi:hypothetical protein